MLFGSFLFVLGKIPNWGIEGPGWPKPLDSSFPVKIGLELSDDEDQVVLTTDFSFFYKIHWNRIQHEQIIDKQEVIHPLRGGQLRLDLLRLWTTGLMLPQVPLKQLNICQRNGLCHSARPRVLSFTTRGETLCLMPNLIRTLAVSSPIVFSASRNYLTLSKQMRSLDPQAFRPTGWKSDTTKCLMTAKHSCLSKSSNRPNAHLILSGWLTLQSLTTYAFTLATVLPEL